SGKTSSVAWMSLAALHRRTSFMRAIVLLTVVAFTSVITCPAVQAIQQVEVLPPDRVAVLGPGALRLSSSGLPLLVPESAPTEEKDSHVELGRALLELRQHMGVLSGRPDIAGRGS